MQIATPVHSHGTYLSEVIQATIGNLLNGFIVPEDATTTILDAAESDIGKR